MTRRRFFGSLIASIAIATCPEVVATKLRRGYFSCIIREVYPELIAAELVKVQPLDGPTGMIFYMNFSHES